MFLDTLFVNDLLLTLNMFTSSSARPPGIDHKFAPPSLSDALGLCSSMQLREAFHNGVALQSQERRAHKFMSHGDREEFPH